MDACLHNSYDVARAKEILACAHLVLKGRNTHLHAGHV